MKLTDAQLAIIDAKANAATEGVELYLKCTGEIVECGVGGRFAPTEADVELFMHARHYVTELLAELRELRALLATPSDEGVAPSVYRDRGVIYRAASAEHVISADYALQLGAALIRAAVAALQAKEQAK